ncbi:MAG: hypothetical protein NT062_39285, partial [Proteobacteria bacterium]|nr:hypothetical protein [Pseudomonadota bacterium]
MTLPTRTPPPVTLPWSSIRVITGKVMDYFAVTPTVVPEASVATDGITPPQTVTGAVDGLYQVQVPTGSKLFLTAS